VSGKLVQVFRADRTVRIVLPAATQEHAELIAAEYRRDGDRVVICDEGRNPFAVGAATAA
jgi:hypothetical protein